MIAEWEVHLTIWLQGLGLWLKPLMQFFTFLGYEQFYLLIMPALYWLYDTRLGLRLAILLLSSSQVNTYLKWIFHHPRPYWINPNITAYSTETSFGMPSGHAQNAMAIWGLLADKLKNKWGYIMLGLVIFLIGVSRIYLGVHSPLQVLVGWVIGFIILFLFLYLEPKVNKWFNQLELKRQIIISVVISFAFIFIGYFTLLALGDIQLPSEWQTMAIKGENTDFSPFSITGVISNSAAFLGLILGYLWISEAKMFSPEGTVIQKIFRYLIGVIGVVVIWGGLDSIFPDGETLIPLIFRYIRYLLVGFWISGFAPWLFVRLRLAKEV